VADLAESWVEAVELAKRTIDEGRAAAALEALKAASNA
jgi:anthranilate phosphoribosyltransferase